MPNCSARRGTIAIVACWPIIACLALATPASATPTACTTASVALVDATLDIDAAHVSATHPASPVGALICSYFGDSGGVTNEATINYLPATAKAFTAVEASLSTSHAMRIITGIKSGGYSYEVGSERFLYVLDGSSQLQMFSLAPLARLEALARAIPLLP